MFGTCTASSNSVPASLCPETLRLSASPRNQAASASIPAAISGTGRCHPTIGPRRIWSRPSDATNLLCSFVPSLPRIRRPPRRRRGRASPVAMCGSGRFRSCLRSPSSGPPPRGSTRCCPRLGNQPARLRFSIAGPVIIVLLCLPACSKSAPDGSSKSATHTTLAPSRTNGQLALAWWEWAASEAGASNPVADTDGHACSVHQPGDVWFLAGTFGGRASRSCDVPAGREIFFPVVNALCAPNGGCDSWFSDATTSATFDHTAVAIVRITSHGIIQTASGNQATHTSGPVDALVSGAWVRLPAPPPGQHVISFRGTTPGGFSVAVTYQLKVG